MVGKIRVGIGGWTYEPWRGLFYPEGLPQKRELEFAPRDPGDTLNLAPGQVKLRVKARAVSLEPYETLEIVYNGKVIRSANIKAD